MAILNTKRRLGLGLGLGYPNNQHLLYKQLIYKYRKPNNQVIYYKYHRLKLLQNPLQNLIFLVRNLKNQIFSNKKSK